MMHKEVLMSQEARLMEKEPPLGLEAGLGHAPERPEPFYFPTPFTLY